jgi:hypothetical protein
MQARSRPAEGGGRLVEIFINGRRVIEGTLSAPAPRGEFHGEYDGHEVLAECTLAPKVMCSVSIDGEPAAPGPPPDVHDVNDVNDVNDVKPARGSSP